MNIIIVIPARGGSKGIPRKNIKIMNGKPLIAYSIECAKEMKAFYNADIVVDTDDEEIAEIAEQFGALPITRPVELSGDDVPLDPVIYHAVLSMENAKGFSYDVVVTMQPTSPTLRFSTLHSALDEFVFSEYETMISGVNEPHLSWTYDASGKILPNYEKRLNRQYLPAHIKETGGFVFTKRAVLTPNSRIGHDVTIFQVPLDEAIDIDTKYDWKMCECILKSKRIILRADGEESLGMGHVYRCISLAHHLTENQLLFVSKRDMALGVDVIEKSFYPMKIIDDDNEIFEIVDEFKPDIVINDILNTDKDYVLKLKEKVKRVVNFEDKGTGAQYADAVINALYGDDNVANTFNGFNYFFIRDEFLSVKPKEFSVKVKNIAVLFGGSDPNNLTMKAYKVFQNISEQYPEIYFHIITGFGYKYKNEVKDDIKHNIFVHNDVKRVSKYLAEADMAITAQGRTIYELACLGVPSIVLAQNERELEHVFAGFVNGYINLGLGNQQDVEVIQATIRWLIDVPEVRRQMRELLLKKDFLSGQDRVLKIILGEQ